MRTQVATSAARTLRHIDQSLGTGYAESFRPGANEQEIAAVEKALGLPLPAALREMYAWHDGETPTSRLFLETLFENITSVWPPTSELRMSFLRLDQVARVGARRLWLLGKCAFREWDRPDSATRTDAIPFVWIRQSAEDKVMRGDWLVAVDCLRGSVWIYDVGADECNGLTTVLADSPSLQKWLHSFAKQIRPVPGRSKDPTKLEYRSVPPDQDFQEIFSELWNTGVLNPSEPFLRGELNESEIEESEDELGVQLPPSLGSVYGRCDGEVKASTVVDSVLHDEVATRWLEGTLAEPFKVMWLRLQDSARIGPTRLWLTDQSAARSAPESGMAEETYLVPFVRIGKPSTSATVDGDWLLGVDMLQEAVWLYDVNGRAIVRKKAESVGAWIRDLTTKLRQRTKGLDEADPDQDPGATDVVEPAPTQRRALRLPHHLDASIADLPSRVISEYEGLVTIFLDKEAMDSIATIPRGVRVRLNPPENLLREDAHVYDVRAACTFVEQHVLVPLQQQFPELVFTHAAIGHGRFSLGLRHTKSHDHEQVQEAIASLAIDDWSVESIELTKGGMTERERDLLEHFAAPDGELPDDPASAKELAQRIRALPKAGSFVKRATLDQQYPDEERVMSALGWADKQLSKLNTQVTPSIDGLSKTSVALEVNCHPDFRTFKFIVESDDSIESWRCIDAAVAEWLDAPPDAACRVPALLWNVLDQQLGAGFKHVRIGADS